MTDFSVIRNWFIFAPVAMKGLKSATVNMSGTGFYLIPVNPQHLLHPLLELFILGKIDKGIYTTVYENQYDRNVMHESPNSDAITKIEKDEYKLVRQPTYHISNSDQK